MKATAWFCGGVLLPVLGAAETTVQRPPYIPVPQLKLDAESFSALQSKDRFVDVFSPFATDMAALSSDAKLLAYSLRDGEQLAVVIVDVDHPEVALTRVVVNTDVKASSTNHVLPVWVKRSARIFWMRWVSPTRVVFQTNWGEEGFPILSFDASGAHERIMATTHSAETFHSSGKISDVSATQPNSLLVEAPGVHGRGGGPVSLECYRVNAETGKFSKISRDTFHEEKHLLEERRKKLRPSWEAAQGIFQELFPGKRITPVENDGDGKRFLALVEGIADAGGYYVLDCERRKAWEFCRRLPALDGERIYPVSNFEFAAADGRAGNGSLILPLHSRVQPTPVVIMVPSVQEKELRGEFHREAQALADMGFAVVQFEGGLTKEGSLTARMQKQKDLVLRVIDGLQSQTALNLRRIALYGENSGAYAALLAVKTNPGRFRAVVALQPFALDQRGDDSDKAVRWDPPKEAVLTPAAHPPSLLFLGFSGPPIKPVPALGYRMMKDVAETWRRSGSVAEVSEISLDFRTGDPRARAEVFQKIEGFLFEALLDFDVHIGEMKKVGP